MENSHPSDILLSAKLIEKLAKGKGNKFLDKYRIDSNRLDGILFFNLPSKSYYEKNKFESKAKALGTVLNLFKGSVTKYANNQNIEFKWKARYHDSIIRDDKSLHNIRTYIQQNPKKWLEKYGNKK